LTLLMVLLAILEAGVPKMVEAGLHILIGILEGIRDNIHQVITVAGKIIENFLKGIGDALPGIIEAGVQLILSFIRGLTQAINDHAAELGEAGADLAIALINGMVRGLSAGGGRVAEAAKGVARSALNAALSFLGISSPSKEFEKVGLFSTDGLAKGLERGTGTVERSAEKVAIDAMTTLRESMARLSDRFTDDLDMTPVISPVLDLTNVQQSASRLGSLLATSPLTMAALTDLAAQTSRGVAQTDIPPDDPRRILGDTFQFNQYNTSPKALDSATIYRQTRNQLSTVKGGLPN